MKQIVLVDPNVAFTVDFPKRVEVELSHQGLESVVSKILRQCFGFESIQVRSDDEGVSRWRPRNDFVRRTVHHLIQFQNEPRRHIRGT
mmetsp:Transcript_2952/g.6981  ORF Transcript_2952/g.6981 Transcript_2952/m.6981 type:complete len:88 (+) Transcript_2952:1614-1877(+)